MDERSSSLSSQFPVPSTATVVPVMDLSSSSSASCSDKRCETRRFFPRELDFDAKANDFVAIYPPRGPGAERRFWVGKAMNDILSTDSKRRKHTVQYYTAIEDSSYLRFQVEDGAAPAKLSYSTLLGKLKSAEEEEDGTIAITEDDRDRFQRIGEDLDKEEAGKQIAID